MSQSYRRASRILDDITAKLKLVREFVDRRLHDGKNIDPVTYSHLLTTLQRMSAALQQVRMYSQKRLWCFPYGMWFVWGAPFIGPPCGASWGFCSSWVVTILRDIEEELNENLRVIELQMAANAVEALQTMTITKSSLSAVFHNTNTRDFWLSSFGDRFVVNQYDMAAALRIAATISHKHGLSGCMSLVSKQCSYIAAELATQGLIHAKTLDLAMPDGDIHTWVTDTRSVRTRAIVLPGHASAVRAMVVTHGLLASGAADNTVKLFAMASHTWHPVYVNALVGHNDAVTALDVSPEHGLVVSGSRDGIINTWSLLGGHPITSIQVKDCVNTILCHGHSIVYTCRAPHSTCIHIRDLATGRCTAIMYGHRGGTTAICITAQSVLLSAGNDGTIKQWALTDTPSCQSSIPVKCIPVKLLTSKNTHVAVSARDVVWYAYTANDPHRSLVAIASVPFAAHNNHTVTVNDARIVNDTCVALLVVRIYPYTLKSETAMLICYPHDDHVRFSVGLACKESGVMAAHKKWVYIGTASGGIAIYHISHRFGPSLVGNIRSAVTGSAPMSVCDTLDVPSSIVACACAGVVAFSFNSTVVFVDIMGTRTSVSFSHNVNDVVACGTRGWLVAYNSAVDWVSPACTVIASWVHPCAVNGITPLAPSEHVFLLNTSRGIYHFRCQDNDSMGIATGIVTTGESRFKPCLVAAGRFIVCSADTGVLSMFHIGTMHPVSLHYPHTHTHTHTTHVFDIDAHSFGTVQDFRSVIKWSLFETDKLNALALTCHTIVTLDAPVRSLCAFGRHGSDHLFIGSEDGTCSVYTLDGHHKHTSVNHAAGGVAVCTDTTGEWSVGTEGSVVFNTWIF